MKKTTVLLSTLLMTAGMVATVGQAYAATTPEAKTSVTTAELTGGTISLVSVPNLDFGTTAVPTSLETMKLTNTDPKDSTVTVSDSRGTGAGYTVDVAMSKQFTSTESHELTGSTLAMNNDYGTSSDSGSEVKIDKGGHADLSGKGSTDKIINAATDEGLGTWNYQITRTGLRVLPGMYAGAYTGELTWTLTATEKA